ncbi:hemerythrin domain-containing protein [Vibrio cincinnatiensis]|uniref:hemerythrin domain-containing protein n=1 Tax=Vibrio cincinnatiensis TaxID=675 RepID=UPI0012ACE566|nr:hemerythrin domain-containing protein [Vibrio cincinnatiensis]MCG3724985.1 hemerythrin domain-containing protein [Vibrio cincinnatiensis]MCG3731893.1 hemerythrin domain-containing protein [Vibrio cincinnatiensis]MCG3739287.1 hemerythrin domain-containing protein [Vibrio cincinnatiensis]MCG3744851.1 hemerythrin domain-containing protein [Vibrio cincinnatiensis]MCG3759202.1 hemerythrin domain-containing protein [Vibrio cincinnatiensis]
MMIERIQREHGYMARLLAILRDKLQLLKAEKSVNYSLIKEIVDYLGSHSEAIHHPKEDIIYRYYIEHYAQEPTIDNLEKEHLQLAEQTQSFLNLIDMILQDAVVPQALFIDQLEAFIETQLHHLELEDKSVLPLINQTFSISDWQKVEAQWTNNEDDPVFGETIAERFSQLARRVRKSNAESI